MKNQLIENVTLNFLKKGFDSSLVLNRNYNFTVYQSFKFNDLRQVFSLLSKSIDDLFKVETTLDYYAECETAEDLKSKFSTFWFLKIFLTSIESPTDVEMYIIRQGVCYKLNEDLENHDFGDQEFNQRINDICSSKYMFDRVNLSTQIYNQDTKCFNWIDF